MRSSTLVLGLLALLATLGPAIYSGQRNFRWGTDSETARKAEMVQNLPKQFGAWREVEDFGLDQVSRNMLQPVAAIARSYTDGERIATVFLLLGPTGPAAVHTPDICFSSRDYEPIGQRAAVSGLADQTQSKSRFWQLDFQNKGLTGNVLRTWYAWTDDGIWQASKDPRIEFAENRYLFKLQVAISYPSKDAMQNDQTGLALIREIEDYLKKSVFANSNRKPKPPSTRP